MTAKTSAERVRETARLRQEVNSLRRQLAEALEFHGQSGVIDDDFINRSSLGHLRNKTWAAFTGTVRGLPASLISLGFDECRAQSTSDLLADLYTFGLTPPKTVEEAMRRKTMTQMLEAQSFFAVLSRPGAEYCERCYREWPESQKRGVKCAAGKEHARGQRGYDNVRIRFIGEAAEVFYRPGIWSLFTRAPETIMMPGFQQSPRANAGADDE